MLSRYVISQVKHNSFFLVGLFLGLWIALVAIPLEEDVTACMESAAASVTPADEYEPHREQRPLGPAGQTSGRSIQRPRYYSTELGMKGSLLAGVLSSEAALSSRAAALNQTAALLQPALRFFITASTLQAAPGLPNVVGFTDTREMLKPFHALKYLADNYLEEYDFFFLVSDTSYVNAWRLTELVSKLSVSQDIYMGSIAEDDSHYCTLEGGILLSNSVLRAVHGELDWCVRNSYSPRHHENLGRCVLHAAHQRCVAAAQAQRYEAATLDGGPLAPALADAVTAHPAAHPSAFRRVHAYVARVRLQRAARRVAELRRALWAGARRQPPHARNATWPGGLRDDLGLAPPPPASRFDHLRWTPFNRTHAFLPDDHRAVAPLTGAQNEAIQLVVGAAEAWAAARWGGAARAAGGAWRWRAARALHYRLLLRTRAGLRQLEVARVLGAARLLRVPYVTETARVALLLPVAGADARDAAAFLRRYDAVCLARDRNTALLMVIVHDSSESTASREALAAVRAAVADLTEKHQSAQIDVLETETEGAGSLTGSERTHRAASAALAAALPRLSRDALLLLAVPYMEFNEEFLNRVRMNTIPGAQWFAPLAFARHAQYAHPRFRDASGARPQRDTGRFNARHAHVLAVYRRDYDEAAAAWARSGRAWAPAAQVLAAGPLRCLRAPEPALVLAPRAAPCARAPGPACLRALRADGLQQLDLGARHELARLLLETQAEAEAEAA